MKRLKRNYYKSMIENVCVCVCVCERERVRERERERDELTKTELLQKHDGE
jgi:DNA-directed RNA polymerase subunit E'/Rpb7